ncbi:drug/metabolite transporter (DMT)-like permease [Rhodoligotrophos appendicifer]|uniref:DMT family transporter n=1 Tax=Rhodoligotrophos appendicifer TaxID=987056 RepID=UPI001185AAC5|nr:DMT family transporter [Rhodoligotrophos appendicifer]
MVHALTQLSRNAGRGNIYLFSMGLVVFAGLLWSAQGVLIRLMGQADPWMLLLLRGFGIVISVMLLMAFFGGGNPLRLIRQAGWRAAAAGLSIGVSGVFFILAISYTTIANAMFMVGAGPFFAALLGRWFLGQPVRRETWIAMALSLFGIFLMVFNNLEGGHVLGTVYSLLSTLAFAVHSIFLKSAGSIDMTPTALHKGWSEAAVGAIVLIGLSLDGAGKVAPAFDVSLSDAAIGVLIGLILGFGMWLFTLGARHISPAEMTLASLIELVLSPLWVWIVVSEQPETMTLVGGAVIISAIVYQAATGARRARPPVVV